MRETERSWKPVSESQNLKNWQKKIKKFLIGTLIFLTLLLLKACVRTEYVYVEPEREPITCHKTIKTPLDMAKCLEEYKIKSR